MKKIISKITLSALLVSSFSNCASIVSKNKYPVTIRTNKAPANVKVTDSDGLVIHKAVTPTKVTLPASDGFFQPAKYTVDFSSGSKTETKKLQADLDPWYIGNIVFGGLIGMVIVDPATGSMWRFNKEAVAETL